MRLIDADELDIDNLDRAYNNNFELDFGKLYTADVINMIANATPINAIPIPEDATNGDMIKAMFPSIDFTEMAFTIHATTSVTSNGVKGGISYDFWKSWWNAPYEGGIR